MKRRKFWRYVVAGSVCCGGILDSSSLASIGSKSWLSKSRHNWVVLYWMPYDNDLVNFGEPIIEMLTRSTLNTDNVVVVQSDYLGDRKMRRRQLMNGNADEMDIAGEDSSEVSALSAYLNWANQNFEAEHWAVIILGHGGKINEISPDDHDTTSQTRTWMRVDHLAKAVTKFNQIVNQKVELLFFQNCNKATLEVVFEARNCARYTLASQLTLGAPNYYYEGFIKRLQELSVGGREVALAIMESERADMYHTLTLVDNQYVKQVPVKLSKLLDSILKHPLPKINRSEILTYRYFGEQHCDILAFLSYLARTSSQFHNTEFVDFSNFLRSLVIANYKTGGKLYVNPFPNSSFHNANLNKSKLCGLSLYFPETYQDIFRYSSLALYQKVDLLGLYKRIFSS